MHLSPKAFDLLAVLLQHRVARGEVHRRQVRAPAIGQRPRVEDGQAVRVHANVDPRLELSGVGSARAGHDQARAAAARPAAVVEERRAQDDRARQPGVQGDAQGPGAERRQAVVP